MSRLVLTRKIGESVIIHKDDETLCKLSVNRIDRNQVRISFEADPEIKIDRSEKLLKNDK
jgi:carbon storage regulator CsrA